MKLVYITVVIDPDSCECLYLDGQAWVSKGETTVYVTDLVAASGGNPIELKVIEIDFAHEEWPDALEDAIADESEWTNPGGAARAAGVTGEDERDDT